MKKQLQRLPPGQQLVAAGKWPIIGERQPAKSDRPWTLEISGNVQQPVALTEYDLASFPQTERTLDIHCVTRWSKLDVKFTGVLLTHLLDHCGRSDRANFVSFGSRSSRNHSSSLTVDDALAHETLIAFRVEDQPLCEEHGGPFRNIVPGKYFYKSVKWLSKIEFLEQDRLGYWEAETGYHNGADPWQEERYMVPTLDRRTVLRLIETRDFSGRDLRSINASDRNLEDLNARDCQLRDAHFEKAILKRADFSGANLSNAHFARADLQNAQFVGADLEGADFAGADLRGTDLSGSSLIGSSFAYIDESGKISDGAQIDESTNIPAEILTPLTPAQLNYVESCVKR